MDNQTRPGKRLEGMLKETLFELTQGKMDPFHRVLADVIEDIATPGERVGNDTEKPRNESG